MQKPGWIRCLGWLALVLLVTPLCIPPVEWITRRPFPLSVVPSLMWVAFCPVFLVWALASIIHGIQRQGARLIAQRLKDAQSAGVFPPPPSGNAPAPRQDFRVHEDPTVDLPKPGGGARR